MRITERERKQYLNQIKKLLVCKGNQRKKFMDSFADNMNQYLTDNPDADLAQLQKDMGTPQEIANNFLENEPASEIKKRISIAKLVTIGVVIALLIWIIVIVFKLIDEHSKNNGYGEITITESMIYSDPEVESFIEQMED